MSISTSNMLLSNNSQSSKVDPNDVLLRDIMDFDSSSQSLNINNLTTQFDNGDSLSLFLNHAVVTQNNINSGNPDSLFYMIPDPAKVNFKTCDYMLMTHINNDKVMCSGCISQYNTFLSNMTSSTTFAEYKNAHMLLLDNMIVSLRSMSTSFVDAIMGWLNSLISTNFISDIDFSRVSNLLAYFYPLSPSSSVSTPELATIVVTRFHSSAPVPDEIPKSKFHIFITILWIHFIRV
jgi:hypothetical protein